MPDASSQPMTDARREAITALLEAISPGEWSAPYPSYVFTTGTKVCQLDDPWIKNDNAENDSQFIAASPTIVRELLADAAYWRTRAAAAERVLPLAEEAMGYLNRHYVGGEAELGRRIWEALDAHWEAKGGHDAPLCEPTKEDA
jgi:hypothetical protein